MSDPTHFPADRVPKGPDAIGLYDPRDEHDACGVGFIVDMKGRRSHEVVRKGLELLINLLHRGACGCEANTGDGAGILIQTPDKFVRKIAAAMGVTLPPAGQYGTGLVFLPRQSAEREQAKALVERIALEEGQQVLAWRMVPTTDAGIGESALATKPVIEQICIGPGDGGHEDGGPHSVRPAHEGGAAHVGRALSGPASAG